MRIKHFPIAVGSQIFKCLGETARLRILNALINGGQLTITDLEFILEYTQAKTSRHITYLRNAGLINNKRVDKYSFYTINEEWSDIISHFISYIEKDAILKKDSETLEILLSNRELSINKVEKSRILDSQV